jgi:hypothetical protein
LAVKEIVAIRLVISDVDAPAYLRQNHQPQKLVFDVNRLPGVRRSLRRNAVDERQGVNAAAASLVYAPFKKHRIAAWSFGKIRAQDNRLSPCLYRACFGRGRRWELKKG